MQHRLSHFGQREMYNISGNVSGQHFLRTSFILHKNGQATAISYSVL